MSEMNDLLTEVVVIRTVVTLSEQYRHTLRHIDPQKSIEVADHGREKSEGYSLSHSVIREVPTAESSNLQVELYDESPI